MSGDLEIRYLLLESVTRISIQYRPVFCRWYNPVFLAGGT